MRLDGSLVVVTGASSGIGRAAALRLGAAGCRLVLVGRDADRLADVARRTGGEAVLADLADPAGLRALADRVAGMGPDVLVNNAGVGHVGTAEELSDAELDTLFAVNVRAPLSLTRAVLPAMLARGTGRLVFVTSIAALLGVPRESGYAAVKAALQTYADSLRTEIASSGVGVTTVVPGVVDTAFFASRGAAYARRLPRPIPADTVAKALVRGIERDRAETIVPAWLRVPVAIRAMAPGLYARLAARAGASS